MGKLVDRDYLWLRETPQKSPSWRPWAPLTLIPAAAALAWYLTAPTDDAPDYEPAVPTVTRARVASFPQAHAIPVNFSPALSTDRAGSSARSMQLALAPAASLTRDQNRPSGLKPGWRRVTIANGDTLSLAFARNGLSYMDSLRIAHLPRLGHYFTRGLQAGDVLQVKADDAGQVQQVSYTVDALHHLTVRRTDDDGFTGTLAERSAMHRQTSVSGVIRQSFYKDALNAGLTDRQAASLHRIFSRDVDFGHDIQPGDRFVAVYDELYDKNKKIGTGPILAAALINNGHVLRAVRYTDDKGHSEYYRPDGRPMRQAFVRAPVDYTHISSPFNLNRMHPILHRIRRHEGTDYAAPEGTPIHATGNGRIIFRGRRGGYGNVVIIRYNQHITMRFAHMSRFARGLHVGSRVNEGQTIGYVGMTGLATGPHVHYEFRVDGQPRNPQTVTLPGAPPLQGRQLAAFKARHASVIAKLDDMTEDARVRMASAADSH